MNLKGLEKEGGRITHEKGFTHTGFQRAHGEMSEDAPRGHWRSFLCALAKSDLPLACRCCSRLREDLLGCGDATVAVPAPLEKSARLALVPVSEKPRPPTQEADPARPAPKPKGRPKKGLEQQEPGFDLRRFLAEHRRAVYTETAGSYTKSVTYRCLACERDIKFCRTTDIEKLYKHERGATHGKGLERMGLVEAKPGAVEDKPPEADGRCRGVQPEAPTSPLRPMLGCIQRWAQAGMPRMVYAADESDPLRDATFEVSGDLVHVRSTSCSGRCSTVQHACGACLKAANAKALKSAIGARCYDMDLCELAWKALHEGMTEAELLIGAMRQQEYIVLGLAGDGLDGLARVKSPLQLAKRIRQRFESIPHRRLSASFKDYLSTHLTKAPVHFNTDTEAAAHTALTSALSTAVLQGRARALDLELASRVAAGALRGDALVSAFTTSFLMQTKKELARPGSVRHIEDLEGVAQALQVLGRTKEWDGLLKTFKVNPRGLPKTTLDAPIFPPFFGSLSSLEQLKDSFSRATSILHAVNRRVHIMIDETVWAPSFEQVRHMRDTADFLVGGAWKQHPSETMHMIPADTWHGSIPQDELARLTLHFVAPWTFT